MLLIDWIPYGAGNSQIISESTGKVVNVGDFAFLDIVFDKSIRMAYAAQPKRIYQQFSDEISFNRRAVTTYEQLLRSMCRHYLRIPAIYDISALQRYRKNRLHTY